MKKLVLLFCFSPLFSYSQNDSIAVKQTIQTLFDGMRNGDSAMVRSAFHQNAVLHSAVKNKEGKSSFASESVSDFAKAVGTPHAEVWNEIIWSYEIKVDGIMAAVWAPYTFYLGDKLSHCGVNAFTLMKSGTAWKIVSITDTRRKDNCKEK